MEENFLDETYAEFFRPTEVDTRFKYNKTSNGKDNVIQSLYTDAGKGTYYLVLDLCTSYSPTRAEWNPNTARYYLH